jgi:hypothetical protein
MTDWMETTMNAIANPNWLSFVGSLYAAIGVLIFAMGTRSSLMSLNSDRNGSQRSDGGVGVLFGGLVAAAGLLVQGFGQIHSMGRGGTLAFLVLLAGLLPLFYMMISDWLEMNDLNQAAVSGRGSTVSGRAAAASDTVVNRRLEVVHDLAERASG